MARRKTRRDFGKADQLPSMRWRARYTWPPGHKPIHNHKAPATFETRRDAEAWLNAERRLLNEGDWTPPAERVAEQIRASITVRELIDRWLTESDYKESTVSSHRGKLNPRVLGPSMPGFDSLADVPLVDVDRARIRLWWTQVVTTWPNTGNSNAFAYKRLKTAFNFAVDQEIIELNPVQIKGAGTLPKSESRNRDVLTVDQVRTIHSAMSERYRVSVSLMCWTGIRLGELLELRRGDFIGLSGEGPVTVRVRRNVQRINDNGKQVMRVIPSPKTEAGNRDIVLPQSVAIELREHVKEYVGPGPGALIMTTSTGAGMLDTHLRRLFKAGAEKAGRPEVSPHDCRRFYGTQLVNAGTLSLEECRRLMGHETVEQLMEYQRTSKGYGDRAAAALGALIPDKEGNDE